MLLRLKDKKTLTNAGVWWAKSKLSAWRQFPTHPPKCHTSQLLCLIAVQTSIPVTRNIPSPCYLMVSVFCTKGSDTDLKITVLVWLFSFCLAFLFCLGFFWRWTSPTTTGSVGSENAKKWISYFICFLPNYICTVRLPQLTWSWERSVFFGPSKFACYFPYESSTGNQAPCGSSWRHWQTCTPKPCISRKLLQAYNYNSNIDIWKIFMQNFFFPNYCREL